MTSNPYQSPPELDSEPDTAPKTHGAEGMFWFFLIFLGPILMSLIVRLASW